MFNEYNFNKTTKLEKCFAHVKTKHPTANKSAEWYKRNNEDNSLENT